MRLFFFLCCFLLENENLSLSTKEKCIGKMINEKKVKNTQ